MKALHQQNPIDDSNDSHDGNDLDHEPQVEMLAAEREITEAIEHLQHQAEVLRQAQKPMEAAALEFHIHIIERTRTAIRGRR